MCTFGVGGNPLLVGLGGVYLLRSLLLGGTGGVSKIKSSSTDSSPFPVTSFLAEN